MLPPSCPIIDNNGNSMTLLEKLCSIAAPHLKTYGIEISIDGYNETCEEYFSMNQDDHERAWELAQQLNAWSQYFSGYANLVQDLFLDSETEKLSIQSEKSISHSDKVSSGDRFANTESEVIMARKKRNALKSLYDAFMSEIAFLERAFYICKSTSEWGRKEVNKNVQSDKC